LQKAKGKISIQNKRNILLFAYILIVFALSTIPGNSFPESEIWTFDKWIHFCEYGVLGILLFVYFQKKFTSWKTVVFVIIFGSFIGAIDEIYQGLMPFGRDMSFYDWMADFFGVIVAAAILQKIIHSRQKN